MLVRKNDVYDMDPITKFKVNGKFPYMMIVHIALVVFTTVQVVLLISSTNLYSRVNERFLYNMFVFISDENENKRDVDYSKEKYLYTSDEIKNHVIHSIDNFYTLNSNSLELIEYASEEPYIIMSISFMNFYPKRIKQLKDLKDSMSNSYVITQGHYGPFDENNKEKLKLFLNSVKSFSFNYTLKTFIPNDYSNQYECTLWKINQVYSFHSRAFFTVRPYIERLTCHDYIIYSGKQFANFMNKVAWVHILVFILAFVSLSGTWKYISKVGSLYIRVKDQNQRFTHKDYSIYYNPAFDSEIEDDRDSIQGLLLENKNKEEDISKKKIQFNKWEIINLIGNLFQIFGSGISIFDNSQIMFGIEILIGFGCLFAYIYMGRYIEYANNYSAIFVTIKKALPNVVRYLLGVMPIFIGFMLFGFCAFWRSVHFISLSDAAVILFSLAVGDSVYNVFNELSGIYFFIGQIYLYSFCILFITVVLNIFIAIVQEAYIDSLNETNKQNEIPFAPKREAKEENVVNRKKEKEKEKEKEKNEPMLVMNEEEDAIDVEFKNINENLDILTEILKEITSQTQENKAIEDIREEVLDIIDRDIISKVKEIKNYIHS